MGELGWVHSNLDRAQEGGIEHTYILKVTPTSHYYNNGPFNCSLSVWLLFPKRSFPVGLVFESISVLMKNECAVYSGNPTHSPSKDTSLVPNVLF